MTRVLPAGKVEPGLLVIGVLTPSGSKKNLSRRIGVVFGGAQLSVTEEEEGGVQLTTTPQELPMLKVVLLGLPKVPLVGAVRIALVVQLPTTGATLSTTVTVKKHWMLLAPLVAV